MSLTNYTGNPNFGNQLSANIGFFNSPFGLEQNLGTSPSMFPEILPTTKNELLLQPLFDRTAQAFSTLWQGAQALDSLFTRAVTFPPLVAAADSCVTSQFNIQELDISTLDTGSFQKIFKDNPTVAEDRRRIQLMNAEQVKAAFNKFSDSVSFMPLLSTSQLKILDDSLTETEIAAAVNKFDNKMNFLVSQSNRFIQKIDISRLSERSFRQIFAEQSNDEIRRRLQLLSGEQVKAAFHRFFYTEAFVEKLSSSQLKMLENSLTDQEITAAVVKSDFNKMNSLLSRSDRFIQRLDISQLSEVKFKSIFKDNPTVAEDTRRLQLLTGEQVKVAFQKFLDSVIFTSQLSPTQLKILEDSLTNKEINAAVVKSESINMKFLIGRSNHFIHALDISQLSLEKFKSIFLSATNEEDKRHVQLLKAEQVKTVFHKFLDSASFMPLLSTSQLGNLENSLTDQEITAAVVRSGFNKMNSILSRSDRFIQRLDISQLSDVKFKSIFKDNPSLTEDTRRLQLLTGEQVNVAFHKFLDSVIFTSQLSASQLQTLENSLTNKEINTAVVKSDSTNLKFLIGSSNHFIQVLDISQLSDEKFKSIFLSATNEEDRRRVQLLKAEQVKTVFHKFLDSSNFMPLLSTSQLGNLENSLTDQEITAAVVKSGFNKMNSLLSRSDRFIQRLDISQLSDVKFKSIFKDNPSLTEDTRRLQLLTAEQINVAFHKFLDSVIFTAQLSPTQLKMLEDSLTNKEIIAAVVKSDSSNMKFLIGRSNHFIQSLDISQLSFEKFKSIFLSATNEEDRRRIQLLNAEQVNTVFHKLLDSVDFIHLLSPSQLTKLENSLTDQEITAAVVKSGFNKMNSLLSRSDRFIQRLDISQLSDVKFKSIFKDNPSLTEDTRRLQLLNEEQVKVAFHRFLDSVIFTPQLSSTQLKMLESSLTNDEITEAVLKSQSNNINYLVSESKSCIQKIDISRLSERSFRQIFVELSKEEMRRRLQLLTAEQVKTAFDKFFMSANFIDLLSPSQFTKLENSLTDQEITAAVVKSDFNKMNTLLSRSDRFIQRLDISQLSEDKFKSIFFNNPTLAEDTRRLQLLTTEQLIATHSKFNLIESNKNWLSPSQLKVINTFQPRTITEQPAQVSKKTAQTVSIDTEAQLIGQNIPVKVEPKHDAFSKPITWNGKRYITFGTTYIKGNSQRDALSKLVDDNHREYANLWNLNHRVVTDNLLEGQCTHNQKTLDCVPYWNKVAVLREWVNKPAIDPDSEEWYVLADDDMPVTNMKVDPYKAIDTLRRNVDTSIIIAQDVIPWKNHDPVLSVNTGLFFVRKDADSKRIIEALWEKRNIPTYSHNPICPTLGTCKNQEVLHEQEAFARLIQEDRSLVGRVIAIVKPRDTYSSTQSSTEEIAINTFEREGCFVRQQEHWGSGKFSYDFDRAYPSGKWRVGDWMGQTAGVPVTGWLCDDYDRGLPVGSIREDKLKRMISKVVR